MATATCCAPAISRPTIKVNEVWVSGFLLTRVCCLLVVAKAFCETTRLLSPESFAMKGILRNDRIRFLLHRGVFEAGGQRRTLGRAIANLRDDRKGREHLPHPLLTAFTPYLIPQQLGKSSSLLVRNGPWSAAAFRYQQWSSGVRSGCTDTAPLTEQEMRVLSEQVHIDFPECKLDWKAVAVLHPTALVDGVRRLRVEDDCRAMFNGATATMRIAKIVQFALDQHRSVIYVFPQWFVPLDGLQHQSLGVPILKRYSKNRLHVNFPLLAENIRGQVLVVHCCQRACSSRAKDHVCTPGKCPNVCGRALLCQAHCELKCADCPASSFAEREWHARDNPDFLLLGREHGFVVAGADSTADADDVAASGNDAAAEGAAHAD